MNPEIARQDDLNALCGGVVCAQGASFAGAWEAIGPSSVRTVLAAVGRWGGSALRALAGGGPEVAAAGRGVARSPVHLMTMLREAAGRPAAASRDAGRPARALRRLPGIGTAMRVVELRFALAVMIGA
ncbi:hypothetical protein, partial [Pseudoxanthobacter sp.]|uniref:hypothetical protein n=1 Tax=Pseudoxanthobacter sp. TaxID=1925742 RepID=UPI002FE30739